MSLITAQQAKLDLKLVPNEKRCSRSLHAPFWDSIYKYGTSYRFGMDKKKKFNLNLEIFRDIFQICPRVHDQNFDELPTDEDMVSFFKEQGHTGEIKSLSGKTTGLEKLCLSRAQILWGMYYNKNVDYVELLWEDFTYQIANRGYKKQEKMYYPQFTKVIIHYFLTKDKTISKRNKIGMHTSRDDYLINTLIFISANEESQIYRARLPESMTSPEMRETAYKTYLGYAIGVTPPKKARKFKKPASPKLTTVSVTPKEPTRKSNRVKRPAKKSTNAPTIGVVIRDTHVMSLSKKKEKMTVEKCKGIELLSEVALTEKAQYEEVHKKSLRDFYKTHPSGSGIVTSAANIKPFVTNEGTSTKPGVLDVTKKESTESEAESWGRDEDDSNNDHDSSSEGSDQKSDNGDDTTQSYKEKGSNSEHETDENETGSESDQEENEEEVEDDEEEKNDEFVKTMSNYTDDEDETNVESKVEDKAEVNTDEGFIQKEGTDAKMINVQQGNENLEITLNQVLEDAHVTISTVAKKTEVLVTSSSYSSDLASKFLNFLDIPHTDAEIVSPMDVLVHHEVPSNQTPTFLTVPVSVITEYSPIYTTIIPQSLPSFIPPPLQSTPTPPPTTEATNPLYGLPNFAFVFQFNNRVSALEKYVAELKKDDLLNTQVTALKRKTSKDAKSTKGPKAKESQSSSSKGTKSQSKSSRKTVHAEEPEFEVADSDMPQDQEENLGNDDEEPKRKVASKRDWFTKPKQPEEPTDPDWNVGKTPQQGPNQS
ncbi:hypothetical protein Tco_0758379 [Tanacetum coccineum]